MDKDLGAVWLGAMIHVGSWKFGLHFDVWWRGLDIIIGIGPWQPRIIWTKSS